MIAGQSQARPKATLYLEHGAEAVWIVNPKRRSIMVYEQDVVYEVRETEQLIFHGVNIDVAQIFELSKNA